MWVLRMLIEAADRVTEVPPSNETMSSGTNVPPVKPMSHLDAGNLCATRRIGGAASLRLGCRILWTQMAPLLSNSLGHR